VIGLLKERILEGSDDQLTRIRPFALADLWAADRLEVLRLFLHATSAGLFQLRWELMCPNCRVPKAETGSLVQLPVQFHCDTCGISYDADLDQRVELRFSVHPAIRRAGEQVYCIGGPLRMPHAVAQQYIRPHEDRRVDLDLTRPVQLRTVRAANRLLLTPAPAASRARDITITYSGGRWVGPHSLTRDDRLTVAAGSHLVLRNQTSGPILAAIDDLAWTGEATSAAQVTTLQDFRDLFSSEVLGPRQQLAVSHIAFLFSDLRGPTQLYEGIGDAAAYSRVNRHFDFIRQAVGRGGGSVIKTLGDGVMCAFYRLDDAPHHRDPAAGPDRCLVPGAGHRPAARTQDRRPPRPGHRDDRQRSSRLFRPDREPGRAGSRSKPRRRRRPAARRARSGRSVTSFRARRHQHKSVHREPPRPGP
jgi:adenylate cyclase